MKLSGDCYEQKKIPIKSPFYHEAFTVALIFEGKINKKDKRRI